MTDRDPRVLVDPDSEFGDAARSAMTGGFADPLEQLLGNLPLTKDLIELLEPPLKELHFSIDEVSNHSEEVGELLDYHCVQVSGNQYIALIHGAKDVFKSESGRKHVGCLRSIFSEFCHGVFVFFEVEKLGVYSILERTWQRSFPLGAGFFGEVILNHCRGLKGDPLKRSIETMLNLDKLPRGATSGGLSHEDKKEIIRILTEQQGGYQAGTPQDFCTKLVGGATLPKELKREILGVWLGDCEANAIKLVEWALSKSGNPDDPTNTILGALLEKLRPGLGDDQDILDRVIGHQRRLAGRR